MKTIFIVLDSLNRHYLSCYGGMGVPTPAIDRLAKRGLVFDNHYCASMPCMPARRDLITGRPNFLETPWSPMQPWDNSVFKIMRNQGIYTHLITDHHHYFHSGGEGYHTQYNSWDFVRGQEFDHWRPALGELNIPPFSGSNCLHGNSYWANRAYVDPEQDNSYPSVRCIKLATDFVDRYHNVDNWFLQLECFDPHEPFSCPSSYLKELNDRWTGPHYDWPIYGRCEDDDGAIAHIRNRYAASLIMLDRWLGRLLSRLDSLGLWRDTLVVLTTDHGHLLGEHGWWGKNCMVERPELIHIPLIVCSPITQPGRYNAITSTPDIPATFAKWHGCDSIPHATGVPLPFSSKIRSSSLTKDRGAVCGYFGKEVNFVTKYNGHLLLYRRVPRKNSIVYEHTLLPRGFSDFHSSDILKSAEHGDYLPSANGVPVLRIPHRTRHSMDSESQHTIYDIEIDPGLLHPLTDTKVHNFVQKRLLEELIRIETPASQLFRLDFTKQPD